MASKKVLKIEVKVEEIIFSSITKSRDNYNSARLVTKVGDKAYMNISVEWEGDSVPSFAMALMGTLQASEMKAGKVVEGKEEEYAEYLNREDSAAKKGQKQTCPDGHMWDNKMGKCMPEPKKTK